MIGRIGLAALSLAALLGASPAPFPAPSAPSTTAAAAVPSSPQAFMAAFKAAINAKHRLAVDALVYWGTADEWSRGMTESILTIYEAETIASAHLAPLDKSKLATFVGPNGVTYGPSLKPSYTVVVEYAHGPDTTVDEGSFVIGTSGGGWYIVAMAPVR
jgi:hypothetical protein